MKFPIHEGCVEKLKIHEGGVERMSFQKSKKSKKGSGRWLLLFVMLKNWQNFNTTTLICKKNEKILTYITYTYISHIEQVLGLWVYIGYRV